MKLANCSGDFDRTDGTASPVVLIGRSSGTEAYNCYTKDNEYFKRFTATTFGFYKPPI